MYLEAVLLQLSFNLNVGVYHVRSNRPGSQVLDPQTRILFGLGLSLFLFIKDES